MANQSASSGEGLPADDNTAWIDPSIENEPNPHDDAVTKVTIRHAKIMWISRAHHVHVMFMFIVMCASLVNSSLSLSETSGKKHS